MGHASASVRQIVWALLAPLSAVMPLMTVAQVSAAAQDLLGRAAPRLAWTVISSSVTRTTTAGLEDSVSAVLSPMGSQFAGSAASMAIHRCKESLAAISLRSLL